WASVRGEAFLSAGFSEALGPLSCRPLGGSSPNGFSIPVPGLGRSGTGRGAPRRSRSSASRASADLASNCKARLAAAVAFAAALALKYLATFFGGHRVAGVERGCALVGL